MKAEEIEKMDKAYDLWWQAHDKFGHSYKSFSHRKRSLEFAKHWAEQYASQREKEEVESGWDKINDVIIRLTKEMQNVEPFSQKHSNLWSRRNRLLDAKKLIEDELNTSTKPRE